MRTRRARAVAALAMCCCGFSSAYLGVSPAARRAPGRSTVQAPAADGSHAPAAEEQHTWDVTLVLNDDEITVGMRPDDTILQAAELVGWRAPYDCRRGNCLTCAAKFDDASTFNLRTGIRHGSRAALDPETFLCDEAKDAGYFLSCCSYPTGPGLRVHLGAQTEAWQIQYCDRLRDLETQEAAMAAVAKVQRGYNERNPAVFVAALEKQFGGGGGGVGGGGGK